MTWKNILIIMNLLKESITIDPRLFDEFYDANKEIFSLGEIECNLRLYILKEDDYYIVRVNVDEPIYIGGKHGYRYGMNNGKFYMDRMIFDEEGNVCRFLSSIMDNEGQLIILEEQYQDFL